jgi:hypothetical protein
VQLPHLVLALDNRQTTGSFGAVSMTRIQQSLITRQAYFFRAKASAIFTASSSAPLGTLSQTSVRSPTFMMTERS